MKIRIARELHTLSNQIMRYFDNSPIKKSVDKVTGTNGWIIGYLAENNDREIYQRDLEKDLGITRSTASTVVNRMVQKGFIERQSVETDARLKRLVLTPKAWEIFEKMEVDHINLEEKLMKGFSKDEILTVYEYIGRMQKNMQDTLEQIGKGVRTC